MSQTREYRGVASNIVTDDNGNMYFQYHDTIVVTVYHDKIKLSCSKILFPIVINIVRKRSWYTTQNMIVITKL